MPSFRALSSIPLRWFTLGAAALFLLGGAAALWGGLAMTWDGPYQLALTLIRQSPYFYATRLHSFLLWLPTVWVSNRTHEIGVIEAVFGAPYYFAPAAGFLLSLWTVHRRAPHLLIWPALGIGIGALPGQAFMINDSIFQFHLFWPVYLGALAPLRGWKRGVIGLFGLWQLSHPIGIALSAAAGIVAFDSARRHPSARISLTVYAIWNLLLSLAGMIKLARFPDPYAASEATLNNLNVYFQQGVFGFPLIAAGCGWWAAMVILRLGAPETSDRVRLHRRCSWLIFFAGVLLLLWGSDPHRWWKCLDYRRWLLPMNLPFLAAAWFDSRQGRPEPGEERWRSIWCMGAAGVFAAVISMQSVGWSRLVQRLNDRIQQESGPVLPPASLSWTNHTPMQHWGTSALVIVLQGGMPHVLALDAAEMAAIRDQPEPLAPIVPEHWTPAAPGPAGWFDFRPVISRIRQQPQRPEKIQ